MKTEYLILALLATAGVFVAAASKAKRKPPKWLKELQPGRGRFPGGAARPTRPAGRPSGGSSRPSGRPSTPSVTPGGEVIIEDEPTIRERLEQVVDPITEAVENVVRPGKAEASAVAHEIARKTGFSPATVQAIIDVESSGGPDAFRFEPHVFHRMTTPGANTSTLPNQMKYISVIPWTPKNWPSVKASYVKSETNNKAFARAKKINPDAAVRSSSWGAFQVLDPLSNGGASNWKTWLDRWNTEDRWKLSTELFFGWLKNNKVSDLVASAEGGGGTATAWVPFAKRYNGSGATAPGQDYHIKLAKAYSKYA